MPSVDYEQAQELAGDDYTPIEDPLSPGRAALFISARHCERIRDSDGTELLDVDESYIGVRVQEPEDDPPYPSHFGVIGSPVPVEKHLDTRLVQWVTNNRERAEWLRHSTGLGSGDVTVTNDIVFDYQPGTPGGIGTLNVVVPRPARSPYRITAEVHKPSGPVWEARQNQWWHVPRGTLLLHAWAPQIAFGAGRGTITADDPRSPLGRTFEDQPTRGTGADAHRGISWDPVAFNAINRGAWTKCVLPSHETACPPAAP